jgi:hypothetical protein
MDDNKRQDQIEKIESLIEKQRVSRRDFFGSLGKIAVLSQVVALGAFNFLSSCVAFEDKQGTSGNLKADDCTDGNNHDCNVTFQCYGNFNCYNNAFTCTPTSGNHFTCNPDGEFACEFFQCVGSFTHAGHSGGGGG